MNKLVLSSDILRFLMWIAGNVALVICLLNAFSETEHLTFWMLVSALIAPVVMWNCTWQGLPTVTWRYRENQVTRIISYGNRYYQQIKVWNVWFYFICDGSDVRLCLWHTPTPYRFDNGTSTEAQYQINALAQYVSAAIVPASERFEVVSRKTISNGKVV